MTVENALLRRINNRHRQDRFAPSPTVFLLQETIITSVQRLDQPSHSLHTMIGSPIEAHPLPGTSKFLSTAKDENIPPPYADQQAPPPYDPCASNRALRQPRTRSIPFASGVEMEWSPDIHQSPDDILFVTVRINQLNRRHSSDEDLPQR